MRFGLPDKSDVIRLTTVAEILDSLMTKKSGAKAGQRERFMGVCADRKTGGIA
jgi:hypothetical protein